jgi:hypothetical protein
MAEPGVNGNFFMNSVLRPHESEMQKRPIYRDEHWVRIRIAGNDKDIVERKATDADKARFPDAWAAYERGIAQTTSGTPLEKWPRMTPGMVATLKGLSIMSVEDMATLSDAGCQRVGMGAYDMRKDAQDYLNSASQASAAADAERLQADKESLQAEVAELRELVAKMVEAQAATVAPPSAEPKTRKRREQPA